jgi:hypothetical protein
MTQHAILSLQQNIATLLSPKAVHSGHDFTIQNLHASAYVYVGGSDVTTNNYGFRINPDTSFSVELASYDELWAVTSVEGSQVATLFLSLE